MWKALKKLELCGCNLKIVKNTISRNLLLPRRRVNYDRDFKTSFKPIIANISSLIISKYLPTNNIQGHPLLSNKLQMASKSRRKKAKLGNAKTVNLH
jgi:hypothetical protein